MKKIKLNLGSGNDLLAGYINIDLQPLRFAIPENTEYLQIDVFNLPLHFKRDSVDEIIASHFFEHLSHLDVSELLYRISLVLKPGGLLTIITPDFYALMDKYKIKHEKGEFGDIDLLHTKVFSDKDSTFHKTIWNKEIGYYYLSREGLYSVQQIHKPSPIEISFKAEKT